MSKDIELIGTLPKGVTVIGMIEHQGIIILATSIGVWRLDRLGFVPIPFEHKTDLKAKLYDMYPGASKE